MNKKVLFISHQASLTGAPMFLLHVLRWLKENSDISFEVLIEEGGPLEEEFQKIAPVFTIHPSTAHLKNGKGIVHRLRSLPIRYQNRRRMDEYIKHLTESNFDLIYSNTVVNGVVLKKISPAMGCPVISHAHELEYGIRCIGKSFEYVLQYSDHYVAASQAVKDNLTKNHGLSAEKIDLIYECIDTDHNQELLQSEGQKIREQLQIPSDAFVVGASGTIDWRKGTDLYLQLAHTVNCHASERPIYFVWVGGVGHTEFYENIRHDIEKMNLGDRFKFLGLQKEPLKYFAMFDAFALMSREDPYPLVCLEAASIGKPILCFQNAGGMPEFVKDGCGYAVPYLDVVEMAEKIKLLAASPETNKSLGEQARRTVRSRHDVAATAPVVATLIEKFMQNHQGHKALSN